MGGGEKRGEMKMNRYSPQRRLSLLESPASSPGEREPARLDRGAPLLLVAKF